MPSTLSPAEETALLKQNAGLVFKFTVAARTANPHIAADILSAANVGLLRALRLHDPTKGTLSTFAVLLIRRAVDDLLETEALVYQPKHRRNNRRHLLKLMEAGMALEAAAIELSIPPKKARSLLIEGQPPVSLNVTKHTEDDAEEFIANLPSNEPGPEVLAEQSEMRATVSAAISRLPAKVQTAMNLRYGLLDDTERTLEQVGTIMGYTGKEYPRQLCAMGLKRLRPILSAAGLA